VQISTHEVSTGVGPTDDLYRYVNDFWLAHTEIPEDRPLYGAFSELTDASESAVHDIVEGLSGGEDISQDSLKISNLYASFMDEEQIETLGLVPLRPVMARIDSISTRTQLSSYFGWAARHGLGSVFRMDTDTDPGDHSRYVWFINQAGLGMPNEEYYRLAKHADIRNAYQKHLIRILSMAELHDAPLQARAAFDLESAIASCHWDKVKVRDLTAMYTLQPWDAYTSSIRGIDFEAFRKG